MIILRSTEAYYRLNGGTGPLLPIPGLMMAGYQVNRECLGSYVDGTPGDTYASYTTHVYGFLRLTDSSLVEALADAAVYVNDQPSTVRLYVCFKSADGVDKVKQFDYVVFGAGGAVVADALTGVDTGVVAGVVVPFALCWWTDDMTLTADLRITAWINTFNRSLLI